MDNYYKSRYLKYKKKYNILKNSGFVQYGAQRSLKRNQLVDERKKSDLKYTVYDTPNSKYKLASHLDNVSSTTLENNMKQNIEKNLKALKDCLNTDGFVKTMAYYFEVNIHKIHPIIGYYNGVLLNDFWKQLKNIIKENFVSKKNRICKIEETSLDSHNKRDKRKGIKECKHIFDHYQEVEIDSICEMMHNHYLGLVPDIASAAGGGGYY